ncbi:MAG: hypothetical protein E7667_05285 [Ruminococcaceae bacterium]|nr:hypothetical protein [Oscillospiraceae bacterium]
MKKTIVALIILLVAMTLCSCGHELIEIHGFDEYFQEGKGFRTSSTVEIDHFFDKKDTSFVDNFECIERDFHYVEEGTFNNRYEKVILYFKYNDDEYEGAKAYCREILEYLGDEAVEQYGNYEFFDYYGNRPKDEHYHNDNFPGAFKRVAFNDSNNSIVFLGIYTTGQKTEEMAEDVKDWGVFLKKYFGEYYSFDQ